MNKTKIYQITIAAVLAFISILTLSIVFPSYSMFGFNHTVSSPTLSDPSLQITITSTSLFKVIEDSYYSNSLKASYLFLFSFELLSLVASAGFIFTTIFTKPLINKIMCVVTCTSLMVEEILISILFASNPLILGLSIVFACLALLALCLYYIVEVRPVKTKSLAY